MFSYSCAQSSLGEGLLPLLLPPPSVCRRITFFAIQVDIYKSSYDIYINYLSIIAIAYPVLFNPVFKTLPQSKRLSVHILYISVSINYERPYKVDSRWKQGSGNVKGSLKSFMYGRLQWWETFVLVLFMRCPWRIHVVPCSTPPPPSPWMVKLYWWLQQGLNK